MEKRGENLIKIMKIYKIAFNISKDDLLASKLSREVFNIIKGNVNKHIYKEISIDEKYKCKLCVTTLINQDNLAYENFDISAYFNFHRNDLFDPVIAITISFSKDFSESHFNKLYFVILNAIKHELKHYYQYKNKIDSYENASEIDYQNNTSEILNDFLNVKKDTISEYEIEPFVTGLIIKSKKQRIPFETILEEDLNRIFFRNNPENKKFMMSLPEWNDINNIFLEIKNTTINKAKQLYPYLRS